MKGEMPEEQSYWEELSIKRIFGRASMYKKSMEQLILAEDTSNVDDTGMSTGEIKERDKQRRRTKAQKRLSSSSESEELVANKENYPTHSKKLPPFAYRKLCFQQHIIEEYIYSTYRTYDKRRHTWCIFEQRCSRLIHSKEE